MKTVKQLNSLSALRHGSCSPRTSAEAEHGWLLIIDMFPCCTVGLCVFMADVYIDVVQSDTERPVELHRFLIHRADGTRLRTAAEKQCAPAVTLHPPDATELASQTTQFPLSFGIKKLGLESHEVPFWHCFVSAIARSTCSSHAYGGTIWRRMVYNRVRERLMGAEHDVVAPEQRKESNAEQVLESLSTWKWSP